MYPICGIAGIQYVNFNSSKKHSLDNNGIITCGSFGFDFDIKSNPVYNYDLNTTTSNSLTISETKINPDGREETIYKQSYQNKKPTYHESKIKSISEKYEAEEIDDKTKSKKRKEPPPDINTNTKFIKQKFLTPTKNKEKKLWSKEEDNSLIKYVLNSPNIDFEEIAKHFESRTGNGCRNRYTKLLQKMKDYC